MIEEVVLDPVPGAARPRWDDLVAQLIDDAHQMCYRRADGAVDSQASGAAASLMHLLARLGKMEIVSEHGRFVIGRWVGS